MVTGSSTGVALNVPGSAICPCPARAAKAGFSSALLKPVNNTPNAVVYKSPTERTLACEPLVPVRPREDACLLLKQHARAGSVQYQSLLGRKQEHEVPAFLSPWLLAASAPGPHEC
eukprot:scaffold7206_cov500-Prasinococcus_capsulatus_cf.AAC.2